MNTEKTKNSLIERRSLIGEILERTPFPDFLRTKTLQNPRAPRDLIPERGCVRGAPAAAGSPHGTPLVSTNAPGDFGPLRLVLGGHSRAPWVVVSPLCVHRVSVVFFPVSTGEKHPRAEPSAALGCHIENPASYERARHARRIGDGVGRPVSVPEGRRRRLAGGKFAPADAAPGNRAAWLRAPAGHRRNGPGCRPMAGGQTCPGRRQKLLRCPAGACPVWCGNRGPRPLAQACPRLISCGVPPGPSASRRRKICGGLMFASATAESALRKSRSGASRDRLRTPLAVSAFANVRAVRTRGSGSLSFVRNGGEGWGEEALRSVWPLVVVKHPSPRSCLTGRGRRTRCLLQPSRRELSHRLIIPTGGTARSQESPKLQADSRAGRPRSCNQLP